MGCFNDFGYGCRGNPHDDYRDRNCCDDHRRRDRFDEHRRRDRFDDYRRRDRRNPSRPLFFGFPRIF